MFLEFENTVKFLVVQRDSIFIQNSIYSEKKDSFAKENAAEGKAKENTTRAVLSFKDLISIN